MSDLDTERMALAREVSSRRDRLECASDHLAITKIRPGVTPDQINEARAALYACACRYSDAEKALHYHDTLHLVRLAMGEETH